MAITCDFDCELGTLTTTTACVGLGGIQRAAWANFGDVDWDAMVAAAMPAMLTGNVISDFIMEGAATFNLLEIEKDVSFYQSEYSADNKYYETIATLVFNGKTAANSAVLTSAIRCCQIVLVLWDNDCKGRVLGIDVSSGGILTPIRPLRVARHLDAGGQIGSDDPRDEIDLSGFNLTTPVFHDVDFADFQDYLPS